MAGKRLPPVSEAEREHYLEAVRGGSTLKDAAAAIGRPTSTMKNLAARDEKFGELVREAYHEEGKDVLLEVARSRAVDGWDEPVFQGGKLVGTVRKFDNTLLMFLIKQRDPSFRENAKVELPEGVVRPEVRITVDFAGAIGALEQAGVIRRGAAAGDDAAAVERAKPAALLPARTDGPSDGGAGSAQVPSD